MQKMTEYFLGLIAFAFVGAIIFSLVPDGKSKRYVRLLCGLCSIGCIAFPIFELMDSGGEKIESLSSLFTMSDKIDENCVEIYNNSINDATIKIAEENLKNAIIKGTSASLDDIDIKILVERNSDEFYIDRIIAYIYPSGYDLDPKKIDKICRNELGKECSIVYK